MKRKQTPTILNRSGKSKFVCHLSRHLPCDLYGVYEVMARFAHAGTVWAANEKAGFQRGSPSWIFPASTRDMWTLGDACGQLGRNAVARRVRELVNRGWIIAVPPLTQKSRYRKFLLIDHEEFVLTHSCPDNVSRRTPTKNELKRITNMQNRKLQEKYAGDGAIRTVESLHQPLTVNGKPYVLKMVSTTSGPPQALPSDWTTEEQEGYVRWVWALVQREINTQGDKKVDRERLTPQHYRDRWQDTELDIPHSGADLEEMRQEDPANMLEFSEKYPD